MGHGVGSLALPGGGGGGGGGKRASGLAQVLEHLSSKYEGLSLNPRLFLTL
jgi:hypothetical protein